MHIGPQPRRYGSSWSKTKKVAIPAIRCGAMDGDGLSTSRMHQTSRLQLTTRKTASAVMSLQSRQIGSTFKAIRFSRRQSEQQRVDGDEEACDEKASAGTRSRCSLHGLFVLTSN